MLSRRTCLFAVPLLVACRPAEILSFETYGELHHPVPYVLRFARGRGALLYFGSAHTSDPGDPQVAWLAALWREFRPTLAFNEGGDPPVEGVLADAVGRHGEAGLVRHLGGRDGVRVASIEPSYPAQVEGLRASGFSDEQIKVFYALRQVPQERARAGEPPGEARMDEILRFFSAVTAIAGPPTTVAELVASCARLLPALQSWREVPEAWFDPVYERPPAFTNEVSRRASEIRDRWVVELLRERVYAGERVFAVMGASHVVMQEPALRARLGRPEQLVLP